MENKITKPTLKEVVAVTTMEPPNSILIFNTQIIGPANFNRLRNANYGQGFRMPTMPELTELVCASLENEDYKIAKEVIITLKKYWLAGNTAVHYFPEGMFVEDNPEMKDGRIVKHDFKTLENKLGKHEEKGVVFSNNKNVRFTPYNYKRESQNASELAANPGVIALLGGEKKAEKIARASEDYKLNPYFYPLFNVDSPKIRIADLRSGGYGGLGVYADLSENYARCSLGVLDKSTISVSSQKK